jgi:hypothetical protein
MDARRRSAQPLISSVPVGPGPESGWSDCCVVKPRFVIAVAAVILTTSTSVAIAAEVGDAHDAIASHNQITRYDLETERLIGKCQSDFERGRVPDNPLCMLPDRVNGHVTLLGRLDATANRTIRSGYFDR